MLISITFLEYTGFIIYSPNEIEFTGPFNLSNNVSIMLHINNQEYSKQLVSSDYNVTKITASLDDFNLNLTAGIYTIDAYLIDNNTIIANTTIELIIKEETNNITQPIENITQPPLPLGIIVTDEQNNVVQTIQMSIDNCTTIQFSNKLINKLVICKVTNGSLIYSEPKNVVQPQNITFTKVYTLDSSTLSDTKLYATANNTMLFKCNWNFNINSCSNPWRIIQNLTINQEYNVNLTNETSAFAEGNIIALQNITNITTTNVTNIYICQSSWIIDTNWDLNTTCIYNKYDINLGKGNLTIKDSGSLILKDYSNLSIYVLNITPFNSTKTFALNLSSNSKINISKK